MWPWDTSSRRGAPAARRFAPAACLALGVLALLAFAVAPPAGARVLLTQEEALTLAFPGCTVARETVYLTAAQEEEIARLAGEHAPAAVVYAYRATCAGRPGGTAYFDTHRVRTLPETLMVVVGAAGEVVRIEVLAFREPPDYLPRDAWYEQFTGRALDGEMALKRSIRPVTGATLTARATTEAVRRVLAIHQVVSGEASPAPGSKAAKP